MTREELLECYWKAYQFASLTNYGCDVGELTELSDDERNSISDALETLIGVEALDTAMQPNPNITYIEKEAA